ncbi:hypothetical protein [Hyperthermus butylicus]|uniref:Uncharacterized protein n=1 Tax=Hyperthermus butylicus (strain DSM 5456 / JCM 9403 / PLM1-5) TaxID=415426 RepID=A2BJ76_HYPBU|nr:hypothetical protein [Hyperthermus butylicus]ABM80037.1 hypothetical protein Hbut_0165 [Hyperthermus butylicus DSM 5456]
MSGAVDELARLLEKLGAKVEERSGLIVIRVDGKGFTLASLPREVLEKLAVLERFAVEAGDGYYFYFRGEDVRRLLEKQAMA